MSSEARPKKQVSERRRQQNKQAQKNYRKLNSQRGQTFLVVKAKLTSEAGERQKRNLQVLQGIAGARSGFLLDQAANNGATMLPDQSCFTNAFGELDLVHDTPLTHRNLGTYLNPNRAELSQNSLVGEDLQSRTLHLATPFVNPIPSSPILLDHPPWKIPNEKRVYNHNISALIPRALRSPESLLKNGNKGQFPCPDEDALEDELKLDVLRKKFTVDEILRAGIKALSQDVSTESSASGRHDGQEHETSSPSLRTNKILLLENASQELSLPLPDIYRNNIRVKQILFAAACVANASLMGLGIEASSCDYDMSPFFQESISEEAAKAACLSSFQGLKEHLRPCVPQVMRAHHPYIDVLPFPTFRERVIKLAYTDEPMIDEDDLCNDLENDGLICWGSSLGGGSEATGSGAPWDIRSWEAQPWFLKKWWILIGGTEGELYKQTKWWCEMRGERSCYPW
jgi:hypothetical protein